MYRLITHSILIFFSVGTLYASSRDSSLYLIKTISGGLSPKSIVHNGKGLFFAQNMMYKHSIHVYDNQFKLVKNLSDQINSETFPQRLTSGNYKGAPVECAFTSDGAYAYVSNYLIEGEGFDRPGCDSCSGQHYDNSLIYKISTSTLEIENIIEVGSVPKFLAISPNNNYLLVSNWTSSDVSVVDLNTDKEIQRLKVGRFPRGIAIDKSSKYAYVAIMGSFSIMRINLENFSVDELVKIGRGPRHLCISPSDQYLYVSLNNENAIAKINLEDRTFVKLPVAASPRSMIVDQSGNFAYVVNYSANSITKIHLPSFEIRKTISTNSHPIGITCNESLGNIWVACYSGSIQIFHDEELASVQNGFTNLQHLIPAIGEFYSSAFSLLPRSLVSHSSDNPKTTNEANLTPSKTTNVITTKKAKPVSNGNYYVIVGSFKNEGNAKSMVKKLSNKGLTAEIIVRENGFHYAACGGFEDKNQAQLLMDAEFQKNYPGAWVYKKD